MKKIAKISLGIFLIVFVGSVYADKGVFSPQVVPDEFIINEESLITFAAEIGAESLYISSVALYETTAAGKPIRRIGIMHDDGLNGDARIADTIFSYQFPIKNTEIGNRYFVISAAYSRDRQRYRSPVLSIKTFEPFSAAESEAQNATLDTIGSNFKADIQSMTLDEARQAALQQAQQSLNVKSAVLDGRYLVIEFKDGTQGVVEVFDPTEIIDGLGNSVPSSLPANYKSPGNDKTLIFAPGYDATDRQNTIADLAKTRFDNAEFMSFDSNPSSITKNTSASLGEVKKWGDYGTVVIHTHGGVLTNPASSKKEVALLSGTKVSILNDLLYYFDRKANRIGKNNGKYYFYPSFISKHANSMKNTFFYLGACESLKNDTMWDALKAKGAKVGFGWSETVCRTFNTSKFSELSNSMLPSSPSIDPVSAKVAFDSITQKLDNQCTHGATLTMKTATSEWDNFVFSEGGIINGDFETGDWTGWTHGGDYNYRLISGSIKHGDAKSAALGRWDTAFHGSDSTAEPYGYEWFYQDFVVPTNVTTLKFYWWMETYDTARWDWFDAYIKDTSGNTIKTILSHAGKPGSNYGPYWTTSGWQEVTVDVSSYQGQSIRLYFDQRLDGYGDQQRVYVDDVTLQ